MALENVAGQHASTSSIGQSTSASSIAGPSARDRRADVVAVGAGG